MGLVKEWSDGVLDGEVVIGIDPSLTGFAVTALGEKGYRTHVYTSSERGSARLADIQNWLRGRFSEVEATAKVRDIAMEGTVRMSASASVLGELSGVVKLACFETFHNDAQTPLQVTPGSLKKYITGSGSASKSQILLAVYKKFDVEFESDDAADSYGLAHLLSGRATLLYERDVYKKIVENGAKYRA